MSKLVAPCPNCGTPASGRFCAECGAVLGEASCSSCQSLLTPGARFCHECGAAVGPGRSTTGPTTVRKSTAPAAPPAPRSNLPFILALTAFVILVVIFAAQRSGQNAASSSASAPPMGGGAANLDIASMSPRERASRLFDRIMRLNSQGKTDSAQFFASMAMGVYESMGPLDNDLRYDFGRVAEVGGSLDVAQAQADSILLQSPDHLLGLILAISVAGARGPSDRLAALEKRLLAAESSQLAAGLPEYNLHRADIDAALAAARSR